MIEKVGNMWEAPHANLILVTTNSVVKPNGALIMGKGSAEQATQRAKGIEFAWGKRLIDMGRPREYNLLIPEWWEQQQAKAIGAFQTKCSPWDDSDLGLITRSTQRLDDLARRFPNAAIHLNYPGIGNGRRQIEEISPILAVLPDNITVWRYR